MIWNLGRVNRATTQRRGARGRGGRAFSLIEVLVVLFIIGILAGLVLSLAARAGTVGKRKRVQSELAQLQSAIDSYHAKLGFYPPADRLRSAITPLFYELSGMVYDPVKTEYRTLSGDEVVKTNDVYRVFGVGAILNSSEDRTEVRNFHRTLKSTQFKEISTSPNIEVMAAPLPGVPIAGLPATVNPWRYVSDNPTNNPNSYDLWAEVLIGNKVEVIGNWKN